MPLSGEEIRARLSVFAAHWSVYDGSERSEAQTFLNELFECYGTHRQNVARFEAAASRALPGPDLAARFRRDRDEGSEGSEAAFETPQGGI